MSDQILRFTITGWHLIIAAGLIPATRFLWIIAGAAGHTLARRGQPAPAAGERAQHSRLRSSRTTGTRVL